MHSLYKASLPEYVFLFCQSHSQTTYCAIRSVELLCSVQLGLLLSACWELGWRADRWGWKAWGVVSWLTCCSEKHSHPNNKSGWNWCLSTICPNVQWQGFSRDSLSHLTCTTTMSEVLQRAASLPGDLKKLQDSLWLYFLYDGFFCSYLPVFVTVGSLKCEHDKDIHLFQVAEFI